MIKEISLDDILLISQLEDSFPNYFSKHKIIDDFKHNVFSKYFIYIENSNIIGFVNYYDLYDRFELSYIEVDSKHRNKRIGSKMMEYLINVGNKKNIINITLEVNVNNHNALNLYNKYDFIEVAVRKNYYGSEDGLLMERKMV